MQGTCLALAVGLAPAIQHRAADFESIVGGIEAVFVPECKRFEFLLGVPIMAFHLLCNEGIL